MTSRRPARAASSAGARPRHSSLAPEHLGEAASIAALALGVGGLALMISGLAMVVMGVTMGTRYASNPPPNAAALGLGPILGGAGVALLGALLLAGALALLGGVRHARPATAGLAIVATALGTAGVLVAMSSRPQDPVLGVALAAATVVFGISALLLLRPARDAD